MKVFPWSSEKNGTYNWGSYLRKAESICSGSKKSEIQVNKKRHLVSFKIPWVFLPDTSEGASLHMWQNDRDVSGMLQQPKIPRHPWIGTWLTLYTPLPGQNYLIYGP